MDAAQLVERLGAPSASPGSPRDRRYQKFRYKEQERPAPLEFPVEEEVPENPRHRAIRSDLFESAEDGLKALVSTDQFVYWDPTDPQKRLAPDLFIHLGATERLPPAWKIWNHGYLDVAVEVISPSDARDTPWLAKLGRYRQIAIKELYRFDAADAQAPLRVWDWQEDGDELVERELVTPRHAESPLLGLYFVVLDHPEHGLTLRLSRDVEGRFLLPTRKEQKARETERAQKEAERAQKEAERADQAEVRVRREVLRGLLRQRGLVPSPEQEASLAACGDPALLDHWIQQAVTAVTPADVLTPPQTCRSG